MNKMCTYGELMNLNIEDIFIMNELIDLQEEKAYYQHKREEKANAT